ncbi:hypothetical protein LVJ85_01050 [Neisseria sp. Dent CA1/247]|uniref:hypothetical protein n=1 Tax=Neisseria sp. Dent CA1/247 TaxID=2912675 RepID=UPI001FD1B481|nr:hypothetical protein [Neisseria sp. Dent CA1/247]UOO77134.1 hypothetical protein LVJ85_01050 [Neisseria sp. Dent CA1/247]
MAIPMILKVTSKYQQTVLAVLVFVVLLFSAACRAEKENIMQQEVTLELGKAGPESFQQAGAITDNRTSGNIAGFLDLKWRPSQLGIVSIKHSNHNLTIPHTFKAMGTVWPEPEGEGVASIDLNSGISAAEFIRHREAYDLWVKLMEQIQNSGWQPFIELSQPRLSGKDALRYFQDKENFGLGHAIDPYILPDFQTWLTVVAQRGIFTYFHLNGVAMSISLDQTVKDQEDLDHINNKLSFKEWGQYMMRITFDTVRYSTRNAIHNQFIPDSFDIEETQAAIKKINADLPTYLKRYQNIELSKRKQEEERLAKSGYKIDTTYQDPDPLPYLQQEPKF